MAAGETPGSPLTDTLLVRYGELGIKSDPVRRRFEKTLISNIEDALVRHGVPGVVRREYGRIFVDAEASGAVPAITRVFGVVSVSPAHVVRAELDAIAKGAVDLARRLLRSGETFAVRPRRTGAHAFTSMDVARVAGAAIQEALSDLAPKVDLERPTHEFHVEVRNTDAYVFADVFPGPGGLPLGTQGRVVALLDDHAAALATWLIMKRGCKVTLVSPHHCEEELRGLLRSLASWGATAEARCYAPPAEANPCLARAVGLVIAGELARKEHASAIVTGDTLGAVDWLSPLDRWASVPVMRPLVGFTNTERLERSKELGLPELPPLYSVKDASMHEPEPAQVRFLSTLALEGLHAVQGA